MFTKKERKKDEVVGSVGGVGGVVGVCGGEEKDYALDVFGKVSIYK